MSITTTASAIKLENGCAEHMKERTIMTETGLSPDTQLEIIGTRSRKKGTEYKNTLYRIVGTDDLLLIMHNSGYIENSFYDRVLIQKAYFKERKEYGWKVTDLSKKYNIPFDVAVCLGTNEEIYHQFLYLTSDVDGISIKTIKDLQAGIDRRKSALYIVLGKELYEKIEIEKMGQKHSKALAEYLVNKCLTRINQV